MEHQTTIDEVARGRQGGLLMRLAQSGVRHGQDVRDVDSLQRAADARDLHQWEMSLR